MKFHELDCVIWDTKFALGYACHVALNSVLLQLLHQLPDSAASTFPGVHVLLYPMRHRSLPCRTHPTHHSVHYSGTSVMQQTCGILESSMLILVCYSVLPTQYPNIRILLHSCSNEPFQELEEGLSSTSFKGSLDSGVDLDSKLDSGV